MSRRPEETFSQKRHAAGQQAPEKMLNLANHQGIGMKTTMRPLTPVRMVILKVYK